MTMDKSLRSRKGMVRARSVLSRAERLTKLQEAERWKPGDSPLGIPKVRVIKISMKKKKKAKAEEGAEGAAAAPAAAAPGKDAKKK
jgi:small basic protein (TIGR04137 family)